MDKKLDEKIAEQEQKDAAYEAAKQAEFARQAAAAQPTGQPQQTPGTPNREQTSSSIQVVQPEKTVEQTASVQSESPVTDYFEIRTGDLENIIYEIDLSCLEKNEICIEVDSIEVDFSLICGKYEEMENFLHRNKKMDLKKFVEFYKKTVGVSEDNTIFKRVREIRYPNRTLSIKMYLEDDILKIEKRCFPIEKDIDNKVCVTDNAESKSKLESVVINNQITIDVHRKELLHTIRELEKQDIKYDIGVAIMHIVGHCIEVECFEIKSSDFSLVFSGDSLLQAYFYNDILDNSFFITTKAVKHNIGKIWKKEVKNETSIYVEGNGADDAWHHAGIDRKGNTYYSVGCNR